MANKSLLDLMSPEDRQKAIAKAEKRLERRKTQSLDVSPEMFIVAELGYYFGWEAVVAIKRGFITTYDEKMNLKKSTFTLEEALALIEGAKKVWYSKVIDTAHGNFIAHRSTMVKEQGKEFNKGMKPFIDKAG